MLDPIPSVDGMTSQNAFFAPRYRLHVRIAVALVAFFVCASGIAPLLLIDSVSEAFSSQDPVSHIEASLALWPGALVLYVLASVILVRWLDRARVRDLGLLPLGRGALALAAGIALAVAIALAVTALVGLVPGHESHTEAAEEVSRFQSVPLWLALTYLVFRSFVLQGIGEELLMRGYLLQSLREHPKSSVWIAAAVFTLPHLMSMGGQQSALEHLLYLVIPFGFAVSAGFLAIALRSVWAAIGIHGGFHLGTVAAVEAGLRSMGPLTWCAFGGLHLASGLVIARLIPESRWREVAEYGPYGLGAQKPRP